MTDGGYSVDKRQGFIASQCNLSFTSKDLLRWFKCPEVTKDCFLVNTIIEQNDYFPEAELCRLLNGHPVYALCADTAQDLKTFYESLGPINTLILVDGGCDALLTGKETNLGTPVEDWMHMRAVMDLAIPNKIIAAVGLNIDGADGVIESELIKRLDDIPNLRRKILSNDDILVQHYIKVVEEIDRTRTNIHSLIYQTLEGKRGCIAPERPNTEAVIYCNDLTITLVETELNNVTNDNIQWIPKIQSPPSKMHFLFLIAAVGAGRLDMS